LSYIVENGIFLEKSPSNTVRSNENQL